MRNFPFLFCTVIFLSFLFCRNDEQKQVGLWDIYELNFQGPWSSEQANPNPFTDYRMEVTFRHGDYSTTVPGFFAAYGMGTIERGDIWRARFRPHKLGKWNYEVKMYQGEAIYLKTAKELLEMDPMKFDDSPIAKRSDPRPVKTVKAKGSFQVVEKEYATKDLRSKGRLQYVGDHYYQFQGDKTFWIKGGPNSPENFLAYEGIENTYAIDTSKVFVRNWEPHIKDWKVGDPLLGGKKGIIGALNYLAEKGMNSLYFLTMNIEGDGKDVFPYVSHEDFTRFDVGKLAQWETIFRHAEKLGIVLQFVTQETENELLLDKGNTGAMRSLYYRELVARFGHHLGVVWNLGEENGYAFFTPLAQNDHQRHQMIDWFAKQDPYQNPLVIHTHSWISARDSIVDSLYASKNLDGLSLQIDERKLVHGEMIKYRQRSQAAGRPWVLAMDEIGKYWIGAAPDSFSPEHDTLRKEVLWGTLMGGGCGVEWYFGYKYPPMDLDCEDWRSRDRLWELTKIAMDFFQPLPLTSMQPMDELVAGETNWCFAKAGEIYAIYLKDGGKTTIDLSDANGVFAGKWYAPKTGIWTPAGEFLGGKKNTLTPPDLQEDWALLLEAQ